jgi:hypothetical protein
MNLVFDKIDKNSNCSPDTVKELVCRGLEVIVGSGAEDHE